ncbi:hypothetical protein Dimus_026891 [Dionaea muscipula]
MFHYKKKEVARSRVRGVEIEFDSLKLTSILGVPGNTGICEYIKDIWEDSKYINTLEKTRRFANNEMITEARRVKSTEMNPFQRRRDDDVEEVNNDAPAGNEKEQNQEFNWEAVIDEAALQGGSGSGEKFYDAED